MKAIMDRMFALMRRRALKDKVAGALVVTRRVGAINARSLLGFLINDARSMLRTDSISVGMLTIGVVGLLIDTLIRILGRRMLPWSLAMSK